MGDMYCMVCREPWDAYGVFHGDMTLEEARLFLRGEGCPCCKGKGDRLPKEEEDEIAINNFEELLNFIE